MAHARVRVRAHPAHVLAAALLLVCIPGVCSSSCNDYSFEALANTYSDPVIPTTLQPPARAFHSALAGYQNQSSLYFSIVFGGCQGVLSSQPALQDTWLFDQVRRQWFNITFSPDEITPPPVWGHAGAIINTFQAMFFGGFITNASTWVVGGNMSCSYGIATLDEGFYTDETWILSENPGNFSRQWINVKYDTRPEARAGHTFVSAPGISTVYLFGGVKRSPVDGGEFPYEFTAFGDTWEFNTDTNTWTLIDTPIAPPPRYAHTAQMIDLLRTGKVTHLLIHGGCNASTPYCDADSTFSDMWAYNIETRQWSIIIPFTAAPFPRHSHASVISERGTFIIHGGLGPYKNAIDGMRDAWEFDPGNNTWVELFPWYTPEDDISKQALLVTTLDFDYQDTWGHSWQAYFPAVSAANIFFQFGGLRKNDFDIEPVSEALEYVYGVSRSPVSGYVQRPVLLWNQSPISSQPFPRAGHSMITVDTPSMRSQSGCPCFPEWYYFGELQHGCASVPDLETFICMVPASCKRARLLPGEDGKYWDFCADSRVLVYGGQYTSDSDHQQVVDSPGAVWILTETPAENMMWQMDEVFLGAENGSLPLILALPVSRSEHASTKLRNKNQPDDGIIHGGLLSDGKSALGIGSDVWLYRPSQLGYTGVWINLYSNEGNTHDPYLSQSRGGHTATSYLGSEYLYIFGGYDSVLPSGDATVILDYPFLQFHLTQYNWSVPPVQSEIPPARYGHSAVTAYVPFKYPALMVLFGGIAQYSKDQPHVIMGDVWLYNYESATWYEINPDPDKVHGVPLNRSEHSAVVFGSKVVIYGGKGTLYLNNDCVNALNHEKKCALSDVWELDLSQYFNLGKVTWSRLMPSSSSSTYNKMVNHGAAILNSYMYVFGGYEGNTFSITNDLIYYLPGCNPGYASPDYFQSPCLACGNGYYAANPGTYCCFKCSDKTTTNITAATSPNQCTTCLKDYCNFGECRVTEAGDPVCTCKFGFIKSDNCRIPWLFVAPLVCVLTILSTTWIYRKYRRWKKKFEFRKVQLANTQKEVEDLSRAWIIHEEEIDLTRRIDTTTQGASGEVWEGSWENIKVAVKKLRQSNLEVDRENYSAEFEREIRFMRSIRHPNIVLFFGAGFDSAGVPFLVTELMGRGSLQEVLASDIEITMDMKLRFALDAAKGMRFLHFCDPPRIHRDLKTGNLLVTDRWVVKVADFGTSRLLDQSTYEDNEHEQAQSCWRRLMDTIFEPKVEVQGFPKLPYSDKAPLLGGSQTTNSWNSSVSEESDHSGRRKSKPPTLTVNVGTPLYMAPEVFGKGTSYDGQKADIYSFGIVLWEIYTRELPFTHFPAKTLLQLHMAVSNGLRPQIPPLCPAAYGRLMQECWSAVIDERPLFDVIVERLDRLSETYLGEPSFADTDITSTQTGSTARSRSASRASMSAGRQLLQTASSESTKYGSVNIV